MNQLVVTLIFVLLPGIIANVICDKIAVHSKWTSFKFSVYAFVLGIISYVFLQLFYYFIDIYYSIDISRSWLPGNANWSHLEIWGSFVAKDPSPLPEEEIVVATFLAFPVAYLAAFFINHKIFNKFAQRIGVSRKYGDENLFSYYLNAKETDWLYIRDPGNNLTYQGRIVSYSETETMQELVMSEVTVYRYKDSKKLYSIPTIYLTKKIGQFIIEAVPSKLLGGPNDAEKTLE